MRGGRLFAGSFAFGFGMRGDHWGSRLVWGGPLAVKAALARKKFILACKTEATFEEEGPPQYRFDQREMIWGWASER